MTALFKTVKNTMETEATPNLPLKSLPQKQNNDNRKTEEGGEKTQDKPLLRLVLKVLFLSTRGPIMYRVFLS